MVVTLVTLAVLVICLLRRGKRARAKAMRLYDVDIATNHDEDWFETHI